MSRWIVLLSLLGQAGCILAEGRTELELPPTAQAQDGEWSYFSPLPAGCKFLADDEYQSFSCVDGSAARATCRLEDAEPTWCQCMPNMALKIQGCCCSD